MLDEKQDQARRVAELRKWLGDLCDQLEKGAPNSDARRGREDGAALAKRKADDA